MAAWWRRYHQRPGVQIVLAFAVGVAAFGLAALVSPPLRELDGDAVFVLGTFIVVSVLVAEIAARAGRRAEASEKARGLLADEQAALRRVATLVARGAPPEQVFASVTEEVGRVLLVDAAALSRYESDHMMTPLAIWSSTGAAFPAVGSRHELGGQNTSTRVFETGRPARIDNYGAASGSIADDIQKMGVRSAVGAPISVEGRLWGVIQAASTRERPLPPDTESRLANFTELVATAIANAESRAGLARLADEQAALRRVATLVARGVPPNEVFAAVSQEVGRLLCVKHAGLGRYEPDGAFTIVAWSGTGDLAPPVGTRQMLGGKNVTTLVFETGRPARIDDYGCASGPVGVAAREDGVGSGFGTPVIVEGRLWGMMAAYSALDQPLPPDTDARLASFTELVATAIANAESRAGLARLGEEQAALRRVATLVARGVPPNDVFAAVSQEVGRLLGTDLAGMARYDSDDTVTVVATWAAEGELTRAHPLVPGPWPLDGGDVASMVSRTGRPVRIDGYHGVPGRIAEFVREELGVRSSVASPIVVEGRLWGVLFLHSKQTQPLPRDTESRLTGFTELVATGIANTQARAEVGRLAEEQAALRRVATLVAREASPAEVFATVIEELGRLLRADIATLARLEADNTGRLVACWAGKEGDQVPVGTLIPLEDESVARTVMRTRRPARAGSPEGATPPIAAVGRRLGVTSTVATPIVVEGRLWGGVSVSSKQPEPLPPDTESRIANFAELVATAIANAEARTELAASRARVVAAADETRRRLERNLHDGAQQRLVSLALELRGAEATVGSERGDVGRQLSRIGEGLNGVLEDLRTISRGLHPAILSEAGLKPALKALARRSAVPVQLDLRVEGRLPQSIEVAAYYVVSEGLANAVKHANGSAAKVDVEATEGNLRLSICDDGRGGADPAGGSGLIGLKDRVEAQGGTISVVSPPGEGTKLHVSLPVATADEPVTPRTGSPGRLPVSARP